MDFRAENEEKIINKGRERKKFDFIVTEQRVFGLLLEQIMETNIPNSHNL